MKNYRFSDEEIARMKDFILLSIENENEGEKTAWRAHVLYKMYAYCSGTKKGREKGERMLDLYERLTTDDLPNWELPTTTTTTTTTTTAAACSDEIEIEYHRHPTSGEIARGYGATHYRFFPDSICRNRAGKLKKYFWAKDDGLLYSL